jgi:hypothetical protein
VSHGVFVEGQFLLPPRTKWNDEHNPELQNLHMDRVGNSSSINQVCIKLEDLLLRLCLILIREEAFNVRHDFSNLVE